MTVALYTTPNCAQSALTKAALTARAIEFSEFSAGDHTERLVAKGFDLTPVVAIAVESELVAWQAHQPGLLDLLADLLTTGTVAVDDLFDSDVPPLCVVTRLQVVAALRDRGWTVAEFLAAHGNHPLYRGCVLRAWLGTKGA